MATNTSAFTNIGKGTRLQDPTWIRNQISSYLRQQGVNTDTNPFAQSSMERAPQVASLMDLYGVDANNSEQFINQWSTGQGWGNQAGGGNNGWDFSNQGIQNQIAKLSAAGNDNSIMRTGDADSDIAIMREFQALANANKTNRWQRVADANEVRHGNRFREAFLNNPTASGWFSEYRFGTPLTNGQPGGPPGPGGTPPAGTPPAGTPPAGTPPAGTPPAGTPPAGTPPGTTPPGTQPVTNQWLALLKSLGATVDASGNIRGNPLWGTEGYNTGAVQNPNQFQYANMSGSGRNTRRGDPAGVFAYRLAQLMNQRRRGGNKALGVTSATTDDQIAKMAMDFVNANMRAAGRTHSLNLVNGRPVVTM
jgi:hypothetical protein